MTLVVYKPNPMPTLGADRLYLQQELAKISNSIQVLAAAINDHEAAWTAYTPTLTSLTGTYTSASAAGRYRTIGKTVFVHVTITVTTIGTGSFPMFTLPVAPLNFQHVNLYGIEATAAKAINGRYNPATAGTMLVALYDNTVPVVSGTRCELTGTYEAA